ncbi:MAG: hypothetical protein JO119_17490 [Acidobacteria bacterium]|nr:hypothetical protein [Acidobacteriota bacterium]
MFDTIAAKFEKGPYLPKDASRNRWETRTREFFDSKLGIRVTSVVHNLNLSEVRIAIMGDGGALRFESSLPKFVHGNNLATVIDVALPLQTLHACIADYVDGEIPCLDHADYSRVDYCHNFFVGSALPDYIATLGSVSFLKHHRITDAHGAVEWWNDRRGRMVRVYDKHKEILDVDKKDIPEAKGALRFEIQLRKKSQFLQRRLAKKDLKLQDVLQPRVAYACLVETINKMGLDVRFIQRDAARDILDAHFSNRKATRLLGTLRRFESESIDDLKTRTARSTYYADKRDLRVLGLFPPSAGNAELPPLSLPRFEDLLSEASVEELTNAFQT